MQSVFLTAQLQSIENTHTHTQMTYRTHRIIITQVFFQRTSTEHSLIYCVKCFLFKTVGIMKAEFIPFVFMLSKDWHSIWNIVSP